MKRDNCIGLRLMIETSLILIIVGWLVEAGVIGRCVQVPGETIIQTDTLWIRDTIVIDKPVAVERRVVDSVLVAVTDTVVVRDSVFVKVPIEQKYYREPDYEAWVSGFQPRLDSLRIFREVPQITTTLQKHQKQPRFDIGLQAGYGVGYMNGGLGFGPYVGVGVSYRIVGF